MSSKITPQKVLPTLDKYMLADGFGDMVFDIEESKGAIIKDKLSGRELLDFFTFFASSPIGYNHPKLTTPKFLQKLGRVAVNKPSNSDVYTTELAEFVDTWARVAMPDYMRYLFLVSGGGLAVENAMKTAFDWKTKLNLEAGTWKNEADARSHENEMVILHFKHAFHGRTGYTLSVTNTADPRKYKYFPKFDWPRISSPAIDFSLNEPERTKAVEKLEAKAVAEIKAAMKKHPNTLAGFLVEPIQAEGGDRHFRTEFHQKLRELTDEAGALLLYDEVQSGYGLTGKFWAAEHYGVKPDVICFGKKSQVCGIMVGPKLDTVKYHCFSDEVAPDGSVPGGSRLNSTWGGNLIDMVRSQAYMEVIEEENLVKNAAKVGAYILKGLDAVIEGTPATAPRGLGLMIAFDLPDGEMRGKVWQAAYDKGLFAVTCGPRSIRFRPPLNLTIAQADKALKIMREVLTSL